MNDRLPNGERVVARAPGVPQERVDEVSKTRRIKVGTEAHEQDEEGQGEINCRAARHSR